MARIKGIGIVGIVKPLRKQREAALKILPPHLSHYLDDRIAITAWYPEGDYLGLLRACASLLRVRFEQLGIVAAQAALQGVYRHVLGGDASMVANRMKANWRNYHDTGEVAIVEKLGCMVVTIRDYGMVSADLCQLNQGYIAEQLRLSGMNMLAQRHPLCTTRGDSMCSWEFDWEAAKSP